MPIFDHYRFDDGMPPMQPSYMDASTQTYGIGMYVDTGTQTFDISGSRYAGVGGERFDPHEGVGLFGRRSGV